MKKIVMGLMVVSTLGLQAGVGDTRRVCNSSKQSDRKPQAGPTRRWIPSAAKKDQYTPLMKAVSVGSLTQVQELVAGGANVNARTWQYDWQHYVTALDAANYNYGQNSNSIEIYNFLISKGARKAGSMPSFYTFQGAVI